MRRGFKAEAERLAVRLRGELGRRPNEAIGVDQLAKHIGVDVRSADELVDRAALERLEDLQPGCFNAATFHLPDGRIVAVTNPVASSEARRVSDLAHELAHILLKHDIRQVHRVAGFTFFDCDPEQEEEANWLAGCLLLPRPLLLDAVRRGLTAEDLAEAHCVSVKMASFRLNASGVYFQAGRRKAKRA
jgi:hypothetical protein